jgi:hypothetical protein
MKAWALLIALVFFFLSNQCIYSYSYRHASTTRRLLSSSTSSYMPLLKASFGEMESAAADTVENIVIEVITKRPFESSSRRKSSSSSSVLQKISSTTYDDYDTEYDEDYESALDEGRVYQEFKEETKAEKVLDSKAGQILGAASTTVFFFCISILSSVCVYVCVFVCPHYSLLIQVITLLTELDKISPHCMCVQTMIL